MVSVFSRHELCIHWSVGSSWGRWLGAVAYAARERPLFSDSIIYQLPSVQEKRVVRSPLTRNLVSGMLSCTASWTHSFVSLRNQRKPQIL